VDFDRGKEYSPGNVDRMAVTNSLSWLPIFLNEIPAANAFFVHCAIYVPFMNKKKGEKRYDAF